MKKLIILFPFFLFAAHIFVLHRVDDTRYPSTSTSSKQIEADIKYLLEHNYKIVPLSTLIKKIENNESVKNYVVFTIDDSYKSFYKNGLPIFKKYKIPFTLFVYVKATNNRYGDFMTWDQVKEVDKYGELGIHSYAHPHLAKLSDKEIIKDTTQAIKVFKKNMGYTPNMYAYPYGEYDERVKKIINKFFKVICNQNPGAVNKNSPINELDTIAGYTDIKKKLKIDILNVKNLKIIRDKNVIKQISGYVNYPYVYIYITKFGWKKIKTDKNGYFEFNPNFKLKNYRNRVIIRYNNKIKTKLILKEE